MELRVTGSPHRTGREYSGQTTTGEENSDAGKDPNRHGSRPEARRAARRNPLRKNHARRNAGTGKNSSALADIKKRGSAALDTHGGGQHRSVVRYYRAAPEADKARVRGRGSRQSFTRTQQTNCNREKQGEPCTTKKNSGGGKSTFPGILFCGHRHG